jgi:hypothetical protein
MRSVWLGSLFVAMATLSACGASQPPVLTPEQVPAAFIAATQAADRTMHMQWDGTYSVGALGALTTPFSATLDFAGADYAGTLSAAMNAPDFKQGGTQQTEIALVGGQAYQRTSYSNGWQPVANLPSSFDPFQGLAATDIAYVAQETKDGARVHHLRVTDVSTMATSIFGGLSGTGVGPVSFDGGHSAFDIWVDAAAHPVSATLNLSTDAEPSDFGAISVTSTYTFTNWGADIYIVPPNTA